MRTTTRVSGGLAMTPKKDMEMLKEMSAKGWHVKRLKVMSYEFEEGAPHAYDYALNMEKEVTPEMISIYEASGWTPIIAQEMIQIYRAEAGTPPIFSDVDSELEILEMNRAMFGKMAAVCGVIFALIMGWVAYLGVETMGPLNVVALVLLILATIAFISTFLPVLGYTNSIWNLRKRGRS